MDALSAKGVVQPMLAELACDMRTVRELVRGLVPDSVLSSCGDRTVRGVFDDSRRVEPQSLFVAVPGAKADGRQYVADAVSRGATVIVGENLPPTAEALVLNVPDVRHALALLAVRWYGLAESRGLTLLGVTGTNGKSTTAYMTRAILQAADVRCGMLGTVEYDTGRRRVEAPLTTPGALLLAGCLRECVDSGLTAAVMEVSSHALDQKRTDGLRFAAAAYTNLTGDHLDYHGTMENYRAAKARLFAGLGPDAVAVINRDDAEHGAMAAACRGRVLTYALDREADLHATVLSNTIAGMRFALRYGGNETAVDTTLVGRHNVYNALAAAGLALAVGLDLETVAHGLATLHNVPGRLQRVPCESPAAVFVDYAHTDDALRNVLLFLRPLTPGRLIVVFGCGGDRDRTKRPRMAQCTAQYGDLIFVTSDNPRTEDPLRIIEEIVPGFDAAALRNVRVEPDRARAIAAALAVAQENDVVLIAGKGHENYQIIGTQRLHFDDVEVAIQAAADIRRFWPGVKGA